MKGCLTEQFLQEAHLFIETDIFHKDFGFETIFKAHFQELFKMQKDYFVS